MSLVDKILAGVEHYANAVFVRTYILRELLRVRRRGNKIDNEFIKEAFTRPRWQEDFVLLLRFFDSSETVTLIDVGANDGTWTKKYLSIYPRACHQLSHITAAARKIAARKFRAVLS